MDNSFVKLCTYLHDLVKEKTQINFSCLIFSIEKNQSLFGELLLLRPILTTLQTSTSMIRKWRVHHPSTTSKNQRHLALSRVWGLLTSHSYLYASFNFTVYNFGKYWRSSLNATFTIINFRKIHVNWKKKFLETENFLHSHLLSNVLWTKLPNH